MTGPATINDNIHPVAAASATRSDAPSIPTSAVILPPDINAIASIIPTTTQLLPITPSHAQTIAELLTTCPTQTEINQIRSDFNLTFDTTTTLDTTFWGTDCVAGNGPKSPITRIYNAFRVMKYLQFDQPLQLLNTTNIYDWLKGVHEIHFFSGSLYSSAGGGVINIRADIFQYPEEDQWLTPEGVGLATAVGLFVHEGWHDLAGVGHDCTTIPGNDSSLEYNGAWAAQYWYFRWLTDHSGNFMTNTEKNAARIDAENAATRFCSVSPSLQSWIDANR